MHKPERDSLDLEPLYTFLTEDISPDCFSQLLDEFLYEYVTLLIQSQMDYRLEIHPNTVEFIHYLKLLRDLLPRC